MRLASLFQKGNTNLRKKLYFAASFVILFFLVLSLGTSSLRATKTDLVASNCGGGWLYADNATDEPEFKNGSAGKKFTPENSALLDNQFADLVCGEFKGEIPKHARIKDVNVKLSWFVDLETLQESPVEASEGSEQETQQDQEVGGELISEVSIFEESSEPIRIENGEIVTEFSEESEFFDMTEPQTAEAEIQDEPESFEEEEAQTEEEILLEAAEIPLAEQVEKHEAEEDAQPQEVEQEKVSWLQKITNTAIAQEVVEVESENVEIIRETETEKIVDELVEVTPEEVGDTEKEIVDVVEADSKSEVVVTEEDVFVVYEETKFLEVVYSFDGEIWERLALVDKDNWSDLDLSIPFDGRTHADLGNLQIAIKSLPTLDKQPRVYVDAINLEIDYFNAEEFRDQLGGLDRVYFTDPESDYIQIDTLRTPFGEDLIIEFKSQEWGEALQNEFVNETAEENVDISVDGNIVEEDISVTEEAVSDAGVVEDEASDSGEAGDKEEDDVGMDEEVEKPEVEPQLEQPAKPEKTSLKNSYTKIVSISKLFSRFFAQRAHAQEELIGDIEETEIVDIVIKDPKGVIVDIDSEILTQEDGFEVQVAEFNDSFQPGEYEVEFDVLYNNTIYVLNQSFFYGVLAVNLNRSTYEVGETAYIQMAALDQQGSTLCDAPLLLQVTNPDGLQSTYTTEDGGITKSSTCGPNNVTDTPDYFLNMQLEIPGEYQLGLTNLETDFSIEDVFSVVADQAPYRIERTGATRINPFKSEYTMNIELQFEDSFEGSIREYVPNEFEITAHNGDDVSFFRRSQTVVWDVEVVIDEENPGPITRNISYTYQAPKITPYVYFLGHLELVQEGGLFDLGTTIAFQDLRRWQLASDADGDFAIYRDTGTAAIGTAVTNIGWSTPVVVGAPFTLQANTFDVDLADAGHYLAMYTLPTDIVAATTNRTEIQTWLRINDTTNLQYGRGQGFIRRANGQDEGYSQGAAIINVSAGDDVRLQAQRTDSNGSGAITRRANTSGLQLIKLSDSWDYIRSRPTADQNITATFATVNLGADDEIDAGTFSRTGGAITLGQPGHYLVTYNIGADMSSAIRTNDETRLTLDGVEIDATRTTTYVRGANGAFDGMAAWVGIIETTSANQVLEMEIKHESSLAGTTHRTKFNQTGITIAKIPDAAEYVGVSDGSGSQAVSTTLGALNFDTTREDDNGSFEHDLVNVSRVNLHENDDYLFFHSAYNVRTDTTNGARSGPFLRWRVTGGALYQYGGSGSYNRASNDGQGVTNSSGSSSGSILHGLTSTDYVELTQQNEGGINNAFYGAHRVGIQGVNISSLFTDSAQYHYRWRDDSTALNTSGGWLAVEDEPYDEGVAGTVYRLRVEVANPSDIVSATAKTYELQWGEKVTTCGAVTGWTGVDNAADEFDLFNSSNITDGQATTPGLLANLDSFSYLAGEGKDTGDTTSSIGALSSGSYSELEYSLTPTVSAVGGTSYCFRLFDTAAGAPLDVYTKFPELEMAESITTQLHYRWRDDSTALNTSGGWLAAEDVSPVDAFNEEETYRLRVNVANTGGKDQDAAIEYGLEFADKSFGEACSAIASWTRLDDASDAFDEVASTQYSEGDITTNLLANTEGYSFLSGSGHGSPSATSLLGPLSSATFAELEFAFQATELADIGNIYCFRLYDITNDVPIDVYETYPEFTVRGGLKVQQIQGDFTGTSSAVTIPEPIASTQNAFLIFEQTGQDTTENTPSEGTCTAFIQNLTTINLQKSGAAGNCEYNLFVVEALNNEFLVRNRSQIVIGSAATTATGSANAFGAIGDSSKVMVTGNSRAASAADSDWEYAYATVELTNPTTVTAERGDTTTISTTVRYEVVEWLVPGVTIQTDDTGDISFSSAGATDTIPTAVDPDRSFVYTTNRHNSNGLSQTSVRSILTNGTTLTFDRASAGSYTSGIRWFVIEFPEEVLVQRDDNTGLTGANNDITSVIPIDVRVDRSFAIGSTSNSGTGTAFPRGRYHTQILDGVTIFQHSGYAGNTATHNWQAIDTHAWLPPEYNLDGYRWYNNIDSLTPTTPKATEDTLASGALSGDVVRLRAALRVTDGRLLSGDQQFKLQHGVKVTTCEAIVGWTDVDAIGGPGIWRGFNNATPADGDTLASSLLDGGANTLQTYEEENSTSATVNDIARNARGEWDFVLENNSAPNGVTYCFRMVEDDGTLITYDTYPEILTTPTAPGGVFADMQVWLKANDGPDTPTDGSVVSAWADRSVNGNDATATTTLRPLYQGGVLNFNPVVRFDGLNDFVENTTQSKGNTRDSEFYIMKSTTSTGTRYLKDTPGNPDERYIFHNEPTDLFPTLSSGGNINPTQSYLDTWILLGAFWRVSGNNGNLRINGIQDSTGNHGAGSGNGYRLGCDVVSGVNCYEGDLAEYVQYDVTLTGVDLNKVESYLGIKYGLTLDQGGTGQNYVDANSNIIFDADTAGAGTGSMNGFANDIAGIGQDDLAALDQIKSRSVNADSLIIMSAASSQDDGDFLVWGNDDGALTASGSVISPYTERVTRIWRVDERGGIGTVTVEIDLSQLGISASGDPAKYALLIDTDTNFTTGVTAHTTGATIVGNTLTFTGVDFADQDYFTIGLEGPSLTFTISENLVGFDTLTLAASRFATSDELGSAAEIEAHNFAVTTNAANGYSVYAQSTPFTNGSGDTISAIGATPTTPLTGTEQFGFRVEATGGSGAVVAPYNNATQYANDTIGSFDEVTRATTGDGITTTYSVRYLANVSPLTKAGNYMSTITYVIVPTF